MHAFQPQHVIVAPHQWYMLPRVPQQASGCVAGSAFPSTTAHVLGDAVLDNAGGLLVAQPQRSMSSTATQHVLMAQQFGWMCLGGPVLRQCCVSATGCAGYRSGDRHVAVGCMCGPYPARDCTSGRHVAWAQHCL
jgi:hypothetical protein